MNSARRDGPPPAGQDAANALSAAEYQAIADNLPTLCWIANADGYITWYNRRWHEYCGTTPQQMEGWGWQAVHDPAVLPDVLDRWTRAIAGGEPFEMVFPLRGADGVFRPFLTRIVPVRDARGEVRRWVGNNIDITPQIEVEQALRRSEQRLQGLNRTLAEREGFLSSILASSTDCIKVLDLDGRLNFMSDGGQRAMEVEDFHTIAGCPWPEFWQNGGNVDAREAVAAAAGGESRNFVARAPTLAGAMKWWHVAISPVLGRDGRPERILAVSRDITANLGNEEQREQLVRIVENSADFIGMARLDGSAFFLNPAGRALVGLGSESLEGISIASFFPPDEAEVMRTEVLPTVLREGGWSGERHLRHFGTGELIPVLHTVFQVADHHGTLAGYGTVTRDLRERKAAEARQQLLNTELSHRLKNVLAVVQSVSVQTLRQATDLAAANDALLARLAALGKATDVLTAGAWASADLHELAEHTLLPHGAIGDRFRIDGPAVTLLPQVTLALALALHELATNAAKYGALSTPDGHVDLRWSVTDGTADAEPCFLLSWREFGGPPVSPPARRGFGSVMIERSLRAYFRGTARLDYPVEGLVFSLEAPLAEAGALGGVA